METESKSWVRSDSTLASAYSSKLFPVTEMSCADLNGYHRLLWDFKAGKFGRIDANYPDLLGGAVQAHVDEIKEKGVRGACSLEEAIEPSIPMSVRGGYKKAKDYLLGKFTVQSMYRAWARDPSLFLSISDFAATAQQRTAKIGSKIKAGTVRQWVKALGGRPRAPGKI